MSDSFKGHVYVLNDENKIYVFQFRTINYTTLFATHIFQNTSYPYITYIYDTRGWRIYNYHAHGPILDAIKQNSIIHVVSQKISRNVLSIIEEHYEYL